MEHITVQVLSWPAAKARARAIREAVFIVEQKVPREIEWDEWDDRCEHALAFDRSGNAIGTARLLPDGRIGRMAVLKHRRGLGAGSALLQKLLDRARQRGLKLVTLYAQIRAAAFYRRFGFVEHGPEFTEAGIPHVAMVLPLSR